MSKKTIWSLLILLTLILAGGAAYLLLKGNLPNLEALRKYEARHFCCDDYSCLLGRYHSDLYSEREKRVISGDEYKALSEEERKDIRLFGGNCGLVLSYKDYEWIYYHPRTEEGVLIGDYPERTMALSAYVLTWTDSIREEPGFAAFVQKGDCLELRHEREKLAGDEAKRYFDMSDCGHVHLADDSIWHIDYR